MKTNQCSSYHREQVGEGGGLKPCLFAQSSLLCSECSRDGLQEARGPVASLPMFWEEEESKSCPAEPATSTSHRNCASGGREKCLQEGEWEAVKKSSCREEMQRANVIGKICLVMLAELRAGFGE